MVNDPHLSRQGGNPRVAQRGGRSWPGVGPSAPWGSAGMTGYAFCIFSDHSRSHSSPKNNPRKLQGGIWAICLGSATERGFQGISRTCLQGLGMAAAGCRWELPQHSSGLLPGSGWGAENGRGSQHCSRTGACFKEVMHLSTYSWAWICSPPVFLE